MTHTVELGQVPSDVETRTYSPENFLRLHEAFAEGIANDPKELDILLTWGRQYFLDKLTDTEGMVEMWPEDIRKIESNLARYSYRKPAGKAVFCLQEADRMSVRAKALVETGNSDLAMKYDLRAQNWKSMANFIMPGIEDIERYGNKIVEKNKE